MPDSRDGKLMLHLRNMGIPRAETSAPKKYEVIEIHSVVAYKRESERERERERERQWLNEKRISSR